MYNLNGLPLSELESVCPWLIKVDCMKEWLGQGKVKGVIGYRERLEIQFWNNVNEEMLVKLKQDVKKVLIHNYLLAYHFYENTIILELVGGSYNG